MQLVDGTTNSYAAKVDKSGRVHARSVSESFTESLALDGKTYNVNTGSITLTSANQSAVLYFKNTGAKDLVITSIGYLIGNSTGGTGDISFDIKRNPTVGTIVSGAVAVDIISNKNYGSNNTLSADAYKGAEGNTLTDGEASYESLLSSAARTYLINTGNVVIPKGKSIGVLCTPQASNTSMALQVFLSVTEFDL